MIWVPTRLLEYKIVSKREPRGIADGDWDFRDRVRLDQTDKHRSIFQRFVEGLEWEQTDCFTKLYVERFLPHDRAGYRAKLERYRTTVEKAYRSMRESGWRTADVDLPLVLIGRDGEIMLGNQGNHRVAIAKVLGLTFVPCVVAARHAIWYALRERSGVPDHPDKR